MIGSFYEIINQIKIGYFEIFNMKASLFIKAVRYTKNNMRISLINLNFKIFRITLINDTVGKIHCYI